MKFSRSSWTKLVFALILLVGLPVFIWAVATQRIELRKQAGFTGPNLSIQPATVTGSAGQTIALGIALDTQNASVSAAEIHLAYDPAVVEVDSLTAKDALPVVLTAADIGSTSASIILGASASGSFTGTAIIADLEIKLLSSAPAQITFTNLTSVAAVGQESNALVGTAGLAINGGIPVPTLTTVGVGSEQECFSCLSNTDCASGLVCQPRPVPYGGKTDLKRAGNICVKPDGSSSCYVSNATPRSIDVCSDITNALAGVAPLKVGTSIALNWGGLAEKWFQDKNNAWYYIYAPKDWLVWASQNGISNGKNTTQTYAVMKWDSTAGLQVNGGLTRSDTRVAMTTKSCYDAIVPSYIFTSYVYNICSGPNGSACQYNCNTCTAGGACTLMKCSNNAGVCIDNRCQPAPSPTPTPVNWCAGPNGSQCPYECNRNDTKMKCPLGICQNNVCQLGPTPPQGCYYSTSCTNNFPNPYCTTTLVCPNLTPPPSTGTPTPTPPQGCYYSTSCTNQYPNPYCSTTLVCPNLTPPTVCTRVAPKVTMTPNTQSGTPGQTLTYQVTWQDMDSTACPQSYVTLTGQVPAGYSSQLPLTGTDALPGMSGVYNFSVTSPTTYTDANAVPVSVTVSDTTSNLSGTATSAYAPVQPVAQPIQFWVKLAGVSGNNANGAMINVKFYMKDGSVMQLPALPLTYIPLTTGSGVVDAYYASTSISNPPPAGTQFRVQVKGEKHIAVKFCKDVGQTGPCGDSDYITMPTPGAQGTYILNFTGIPLPPGDLNQDGKVDAADIKIITDLFAKTPSQLTAADYKLADVDYSGTIDHFDLNWILQALSIRYDE